MCITVQNRQQGRMSNFCYAPELIFLVSAALARSTQNRENCMGKTLFVPAHPQPAVFRFSLKMPYFTTTL
jgi:hypothetical protein